MAISFRNTRPLRYTVPSHDQMINRTTRSNANFATHDAFTTTLAHVLAATQAKEKKLTPEDERECGRPLGVKWRRGKLYILDAYHGLFELDVAKGGHAKHLARGFFVSRGGRCFVLCFCIKAKRRACGCGRSIPLNFRLLPVVLPNFLWVGFREVVANGWTTYLQIYSGDAICYRKHECLLLQDLFVVCWHVGMWFFFFKSRIFWRFPPSQLGMQYYTLVFPCCGGIALLTMYLVSHSYSLTSPPFLSAPGQPAAQINSLTDMPLPLGGSDGEAAAPETKYPLAFLNDFVFSKEGTR